MTVAGHDLLEPVFIEKGGSQVALRIEVGGDDAQAAIGEHPREVVDHRGLADTHPCY